MQKATQCKVAQRGLVKKFNEQSEVKRCGGEKVQE